MTTNHAPNSACAARGAFSSSGAIRWSSPGGWPGRSSRRATPRRRSPPRRCPQTRRRTRGGRRSNHGRRQALIPPRPGMSFPSTLIGLRSPRQYPTTSNHWREHRRVRRIRARARMRVVVRALQRIDWQMGRLLRVFLDRRLYWLMQFPSTARYLRERLGISPRKARALVALERKTWTTPGLGEAYRSGGLSWVRALTILPVVNEDTGPAWVARAGEVTVRRLADEVEWALVVRDGVTPIAPPLPGADLVLEERQMCARRDWEYPDAEIVFRAAVSVVSLFRTAV